jgi:hypothetical protein
MPLFQDVLTWSRTLAPWAQDALRRVFTEDDLTDQDYDELSGLLLAAHGAPDAGGVVAEPLDGSHLPAIPTAAVTAICGISAMRHINRFPPDSSVSFSPAGLTVIYGENGSGSPATACLVRKHTKWK